MRGIANIIFVVSTVAACGGPSDSPPGPLGKHFDDMYIAAIPLDLYAREQGFSKITMNLMGF